MNFETEASRANKEAFENKTLGILDEVVVEFIQQFKGNYAIKGGYLLTKLLSNARATVDVDISIDDTEKYEHVKQILANIADSFVKRGTIDYYKVKQEISGNKSGGIMCYKKGVAGDKLVFGVDIGYHQLVMGIREMSFTFGDVKAFKVERILADKISAILSSKRFRRVKDVYDLYHLVINFDVEYDTLVKLLNDRLLGQEYLWDNIPFSEVVIEQYKYAYERFTPINQVDGSQLNKENFADVVYMFYRFVEPIKQSEQYTRWDIKELRWL